MRSKSSRPARRAFQTAMAALTATVLLVSGLVASAPAVAHSASSTTSGITSVGIHEGSSSGMRYSGRWSTIESRADSGGSSRYLNSTGSTSLTFSGRSVQVLSRVTPSAGIADIYLDGRKVASVDRYSATTLYQQTVFAKEGLAAGSHTIKIAWSGTANSRSSGKNLVVDAIVVPDITAPVAPAGVTVTASGPDANLAWKPVTDAGLTGYRVYARAGSGEVRLIGQTLKGKTTFRSIGLPSYASLAFHVTALDSWGNESRASSVASLRTSRTPSGSHRYDDCPVATTTVRTIDGFKAAAARATPGTVIRLAAGTYRGQLQLTADGTAAKPIWVCGSRDVVIDGGSLRENSPIDVSNSSHVIVTGMTARNALKGVTVRASDHVTISDMMVENIGYEGIHLRSRTTDSTVVGNTVRRTGRLDAFYGEGIYIGSSKNNWCALTDCGPDRSDRNAVLDNSVSLTGSDLIEAKEGTTGGLIAGNDLDGTGGMARTESWIMLSGNDWVVIDNTARESSEHGFRINGDMPGWGVRSVLADNIGRVDAAGFGFKLWEPAGDGTSRTLLLCDNAITGAASGFSNLPCSD